MKRLELKLELRRCSTARRSVQAGAEARAEELKLPKRRAEAAITARRSVQARAGVKLELKT